MYTSLKYQSDLYLSVHGCTVSVVCYTMLQVRMKFGVVTKVSTFSHDSGGAIVHSEINFLVIVYLVLYKINKKTEILS